MQEHVDWLGVAAVFAVWGTLIWSMWRAEKAERLLRAEKAERLLREAEVEIGLGRHVRKAVTESKFPDAAVLVVRHIGRLPQDGLDHWHVSSCVGNGMDRIIDAVDAYHKDKQPQAIPAE